MFASVCTCLCDVRACVCVCMCVCVCVCASVHVYFLQMHTFKSEYKSILMASTSMAKQRGRAGGGVSKVLASLVHLEMI